MAKLSIKPGSTDVTIPVWVADSASTTGGGKTGIAYNAASFTCYYWRPGSSAAALTLATQTVNGAHSDGGWVEVDSTNMPGLYRLDLSDAIVAAGVRSVTVLLKGTSGMAPVVLEIDLSSQVDMTAIDGTSAPATVMTNAFADLMGTRVTAQTGSTSTSIILDSGASAVDDYYNGSVLVFTSGNLNGQARKITDYVGSTKTATVTAFTTSPANGDTAIILGRIE